MKLPRNQREEVLYMLLREANITHLSLPYVMNLTSVIAKLRNAGVVINCHDQSHVNKFGRKITYGVWSIPWNELESAVQIYERMTKELEVAQ
ncbi:MAG: hypothetical protein IPK58_22160 [Acidobacteria bacterium]|nr:hypothetical protein [Acidobacteriota bacterium]